ncbi:MAG: hypothetical protein HY394_01000 [Candidatus Diapherotrites archaeon]|nr:hypothetical protein [Candidatus Diapherotrites archaeon]
MRMSTITTIKLKTETKSNLEAFREYESETFDEIIRKLVFIGKTAKNNPKLSRKTALEIEAARKRIKAGQYYSEEEARKILGL